MSASIAVGESARAEILNAIEYPITDEIDCSGWDICKVLYWFIRTNGALLEWLNSPIRYIEQGQFADMLRNITRCRRSRHPII